MRRPRITAGAIGLLVLLAGVLPAEARTSDPALAARQQSPVGICSGEALQRFVADPVGVEYCDGVAPGALFEMNNQSGEERSCRFSYAFQGSDKRTYLHSHGSCYLEPTCLEVLGLELPVCIVIAYNDEEPVFAPGKGIPVRLPDSGRRVGELAYAVYDGTYDFALIRLDKGIPFTPQVCGTGGPTALDSTVSTTPASLVVSNGSAHAPAVAARGLYHPLRVGSAYGMPGVTGAPVLRDTGEAVGVTIGLGIGVSGGDIIERTSQPLARASYRTGVRLRLLTAPLL